MRPILLLLALAACAKKSPVPTDSGTDSGAVELSCTSPALDGFLEAYGGEEAFTPLTVEAVGTLLAVEELVDAGEHAFADGCLDAVFDAHPTGTAEWGEQGAQQQGTNVGWPVGYYGLRMLRDIVDTHLAGPEEPVGTATLTVIRVGCSEGVQPSTWDELNAGTGTFVTNELDPGLTDAVVLQSLSVFRQWVWAITDGRLEVDVDIVDLPDTCVPVGTSVDPYRVAGMTDLGPIWDATAEVKTDWRWILYPSHVPEQHADFEDTEFITGGMGVGPDGRSPAFLIDDRWLLRKPPHLGDGPMSEVERRAYLPQWLQHEFAHHLFRTWPEYGLEASSHQWFDRSTWPEDFEGTYEPDYYAEAVHKRLKDADPPMHVALRYGPPPSDVLAQLEPADLLGSYVREPAENDWHTGTITADGENLRWTNDAGVSWGLEPALGQGLLLLGTDCPYYESGARSFTVDLAKDSDGNYQPVVTGFWFGAERYIRQ